MQVSFEQCVMQTPEAHETQCNLITTASDSAFHSTTYGINCNSPLNNLAYYHVTNYGLPPDPMHDLLEGYTNKLTKILLYLLINEQQWFDLVTLNTVIKSFPYGTSTKPNCITDKELISEAKLNQSGKYQHNHFYDAMQMLTANTYTVCFNIHLCTIRHLSFTYENIPGMKYAVY